MTIKTETRPTLYRKLPSGNWKAVAQYSTLELATAALERIKMRSPDEYGFKVAIAAHRPETGKYDKRGRWCKSGIRQVTKDYS